MDAPWVMAAIGNRLRADDAIGLRLVETLQRRLALSLAQVRLWEDADALTLAHELIETDAPVLLVDCADMGLAPGSARLFSEHELRGRHTLSTHGLGMAQALQLARAGGYGHGIRVMGIQPESLLYSDSLSETLEGRFASLCESLAEFWQGCVNERHCAHG